MLKSISRRTLLAAAVVLAMPALAQQSTRADLNLDDKGVMIQGYDPVAYFTVGKPTKGLVTVTATHDGGTYQFADAANRDLFVKEPAKYVPQFGGYCAMGAVFNKKFNGDPNLWKIVDGKLYLNVNPDVQKRWEGEIPANIAKANGNWTAIKAVPAKELNAR